MRTRDGEKNESGWETPDTCRGQGQGLAPRDRATRQDQQDLG